MAKAKKKENIWAEVGKGVGKELFGLGSATVREACGVVGILPMNKPRDVGKWKTPRRRR